MAAARLTFAERQGRLAAQWDKFGPITGDYLGIPYIKDGRAVFKSTGQRDGVATRDVGLVCTSFVDVVLSRYVRNDPSLQLDSYKFGDGVNIFDRYRLTRAWTNLEPDMVASLGLNEESVYGVVFHMKNSWVKNTRNGPRRRPPGSRIHVGFLAYHNHKLFLIHASGRKGVHVVAWQRFLNKLGKKLQKYAIPGPKCLSLYHLGEA